MKALLIPIEETLGFLREPTRFLTDLGRNRGSSTAEIPLVNVLVTSFYPNDVPPQAFRAPDNVLGKRCGRVIVR